MLPVLLLLLLCTGREGCCQPSFKQVQAASCELCPSLGTACKLCDALVCPAHCCYGMQQCCSSNCADHLCWLAIALALLRLLACHALRRLLLLLGQQLNQASSQHSAHEPCPQLLCSCLLLLPVGVTSIRRACRLLPHHACEHCCRSHEHSGLVLAVTLAHGALQELPRGVQLLPGVAVRKLLLPLTPALLLACADVLLACMPPLL